VELLISGQEDVDPKMRQRLRTLREIAAGQDTFSQAPALPSRDDGSLTMFSKDSDRPDRANVSGITNADVADASTAAMSGSMVGVF